MSQTDAGKDYRAWLPVRPGLFSGSLEPAQQWQRCDLRPTNVDAEGFSQPSRNNADNQVILGG